jgi:hypothetical protein
MTYRNSGGYDNNRNNVICHGNLPRVPAQPNNHEFTAKSTMTTTREVDDYQQQKQKLPNQLLMLNIPVAPTSVSASFPFLGNNAAAAHHQPIELGLGSLLISQPLTSTSIASDNIEEFCNIQSASGIIQRSESQQFISKKDGPC